MIVINLLPEDRRPVERTPLPRFLVIVAGVAGFCLEIVVLGMFWLKFPEMTRTREGIKVQQMRLQEQVKRVEDVDRKIARIRQRGDQIEKLLQERRAWAPILHRLTDPAILPAAIWFKTLKLQEDKRVRGGPGAGGSISLVVEGYARGPDSATMMQEVPIFVGNLKQLYEAFPDVFEGTETVTGRTLQKLSGGKDTAEGAPEEAAAFTVKMPLKKVGALAAKKKRQRQ